VIKVVIAKVTVVVTVILVTAGAIINVLSSETAARAFAMTVPNCHIVIKVVTVQATVVGTVPLVTAIAIMPVPASETAAKASVMTVPA
jgi:hypothetical protein